MRGAGHDRQDKQAPTGPDTVLRDLVSDPEKLTNIINSGDFGKVIDAYAAERAREYEGELATKIQDGLMNQVRAQGGGRGPGVDLDTEVRNGKPAVKVDGKSVSLGRGAVYNKTAPGARFEQAVKVEDRFGSIGEYLQAIREEARPTATRNRKELLQKLENVRSFQNSFGSEDPGAGGFLIPEIMRSELLQLALEESIVRSRATVIPMSTLRVPIPTVDDTSHVSSLFGGVEFYWAEEASSLTESTATFGKVVLDAKKLTGFFKVPNELLADAPAFSGWFDTRIPQGLAWAEDVAFLNETGAGTPMGVIGAQNPAYVQATRATENEIAYADIVGMYTRMLPTSLKNAVWIASIDAFPQLAQMSLSTPGVWMGGYNVPGVADAPPVSIFGRPVYFTEKVPAVQTSGGAVGDISFVDLSYYLIGDRQSVAVSASDQFAFQNDQTAYRIIERVDGRPWLQSALTPHGGQATLSAYVGLAQT